MRFGAVLAIIAAIVITIFSDGRAFFVLGFLVGNVITDFYWVRKTEATS
jgi:hypothetical protein